MANISSVEHSVNIGISDAYYVDKLRHYYGICKCCMIIMQSANCKFPGAYFVPQSIHIISKNKEDKEKGWEEGIMG